MPACSGGLGGSARGRRPTTVGPQDAAGSESAPAAFFEFSICASAGPGGGAAGSC